MPAASHHASHDGEAIADEAHGVGRAPWVTRKAGPRPDRLAGLARPEVGEAGTYIRRVHLNLVASECGRAASFHARIEARAAWEEGAG